MKRARASGGLRAAALTAVSALAFALLSAIGVTHAVADTPINVGPITYHCTYPLIGSQPMVITGSTNLPAFQTGNSYNLTINAHADVPVAAADGMWEARAQTLTGTAVVHATLYTPDKPSGVDVTTTATLPSTPITGAPTPAGSQGVALPGPEPTTGFTIQNIQAVSPTVTLGKTAGWAQINVNNIDLDIKPLDAQGNPTSLGEFKPKCWFLPSNGSNVLGQAWISDGHTQQTPQPKPISSIPPQGPETVTGATYPSNPQSLANPLNFTCAIGLGVGSPTIPVTMSVDYPAQINTNTLAPVLKIPISAHIDSNTTNGIDALGGYYIEGYAISYNVIKTPDFPNGVRAETTAQLPVTAVPQSPDGGITPPDPFDIKGVATAPQLVYQTAGKGSVTIGDTPPTNVTTTPDMVLDMTLLDQNQKPVKNFARNCALPTSQQGQTLANWTVNQTASGAPTVPTNVKATANTDGSVDFSWTASTNSTASGVSGYNVFVDGTNIGTVGGTSLQELPGAIANGSHKVTVSAYDTSATPKESAQSDPATFQIGQAGPQAPNAPTGVTATNVTATTADVSWTAPAVDSTHDAATTYDVYSGSTVVAHDVTTTSTTVSNLTPNTAYQFTVVAKNGGGSSTPSAASASVTTLPYAPGAPTGLTAGTPTATTVPLSWTAPATDSTHGAPTGYDVYSGGNVVASSAGTDTNATVQGLTPGTAYTFTVKAKNAGGSSADSNSVSATTLQNSYAPGAPTGLTAGTPTATSVPLSWTAPAVDATHGAATSYDILDGTTVVGNVKDPTTAYTVTGLTAGSSHTFTVVAKNSTGSSGPSNAVSVTLPAVPAAPTGLAASNVTATSADLSWTGSAGATGYVVTCNNAQVATTKDPTTKATVTGLTPSTAYTCTVAATNAVGSSGNSDPATFTTTGTAPAAPTNVHTTNVSAYAVSLAWDASAGATGYDVYSGKAVVASSTTTSATVSNLTPDTDYSFTVVAKNTAGTSPASQPVTAHTQPVGGPTPANYALSGSTTIKAANGTADLSGGVKAMVDAAGKITADLTLNPTTAKLNLLGFLPGTADIVFAPQGQTTGTTTGSTLNTSTSMAISVPKVTIFGMTVAGGTTCQSATPFPVGLSSKNWNTASGGTLSGSYTLPSLKGCGLFTPLVSAFTAGPGNNISLTLTKTN